MKKIALMVMVICGISTVSKAQTDGKTWIGGSIGFTTSKIKSGQSITGYSFLPEVGYAFSDKWGVGVSLGYSHDESTTNDVKTKSNTFILNPFARYTFLRWDIASIFVDGGVAYNYRKLKPADNEIHVLELGLRPGLTFNVSDRILLTGKFGFFGYQYSKYLGYKQNTFAFNCNLENIQLGVSILF